MENRIDIKAIVHGRVQGVGFRITAQQHGKRLGLVGTARNMPDGTVELCIRGPQETINNLFAALHEEFPGYIQEIVVENAPLTKSLESFTITS